MKPNVGMNYPVAAAISAYTPGSAITYGTGFVVSEARGASLQWETENGEFYGDDVLLDAAKGIIGYTLDFEAAGLSDTVREKLLGESKSSDEYSITGADAPDVGFGYIRVMRDNASGSVVENYEGWWFHKIKFGQPNEEARTKERSIEWRTPTLSGRGTGVQLSSGETVTFAVHQSFETLSAAKTWLNSKASIT